MEKRKLKKMKVLEPSEEMVLAAESDIPVIGNMAYERMKYPIGLFIQAEMDENILKIGFFITDILTAGGRRPLYTLFIDKAKDCFIGYDYRLKGWTNKMLDKIEWPSGIKYSHAWCAANSLDQIWEILGEEYKKDNVYYAILQVEEGVRRRKRIQKNRLRTQTWDQVMNCVKNTPKDWDRWMKKVGITRNYIFYKYSRKEHVTGYCTWCEKNVTVKAVKHNKTGKCPNCGHKIQYKAIGKQRMVSSREETAYLLQTCGQNFVVREFRASVKYDMLAYTKPIYNWWEQRRFVYDTDLNKKEFYYGYYRGTDEHRWIQGELYPNRPYYWGYEPRYPGRIYKKSLHGIQNKQFRRSGFYELIRKSEKIEPIYYLDRLSWYPYFEQLAKAGLDQLVDDILSTGTSIYFQEADSLGHALGIDKFRLNRLRNNKGGRIFLEWLIFEKGLGKVIKDDVIAWFSKCKINPTELSFILDRMSPEQIKNYLEKQAEESEKKPKDLVGTWKDYLDMAEKLGLNVKDSIVYRVRKLELRHNEVIQMLKDKEMDLKADEIVEKFPTIEAVCESLKKYEYKDQKYQIVAPRSVRDIFVEGNELKHCITGKETYFDRMAKQESYLLFLRKTDTPEKPYYTLEVEPDGTVRQKRTYFDRQNPDIEEAKKFLVKWQKQLTRKLNKEDKILSLKSRDLRKKEIEDLRKKKVKVNGFGFTGKLLADILEEDLMENAA